MLTLSCLPPHTHNLDAFFGKALVGCLEKVGLSHAVLSAGGRLSPLIFALQASRQIKKVVTVDERSAAFLALGMAKRLQEPVALLCTSGSAVAHYLPAVVEAYFSGVPLLVITADAPLSEQARGVRQVIAQKNIFGHYLCFKATLDTTDSGNLPATLETVLEAYQKSLKPLPGPVHLNLPIAVPDVSRKTREAPVLEAVDLKSILKGMKLRQTEEKQGVNRSLERALKECLQEPKGLLIAGESAGKSQVYLETLRRLADLTKWPILADISCPARCHSQHFPFLVSTYHSLLKNPESALFPKTVLQVGRLPLSGTLRAWLARLKVPLLSVGNLREENALKLPLRSFSIFHGTAARLRVCLEENCLR